MYKKFKFQPNYSKAMKNFKGISLPIETMVIIAIVILVLVVIVAFFIGGSGQQLNSIGHDAAIGKGCVILGTQNSCKINGDKESSLRSIQIAGYDPDGDGTSNSLFDACNNKGLNADTCWKYCGCAG